MVDRTEIVSPGAIHRTAREKGWWDNGCNVPEKLCLIHSEVSEALEAFRNGIEPGQKGWIGEELADVIIRIFDLCCYLRIPIITEVERKHHFNQTRPFRHGGKLC
jgi:NTP pyrophosphatase (non-canonical NTP hydrolase)